MEYKRKEITKEVKTCSQTIKNCHSQSDFTPIIEKYPFECSSKPSEASWSKFFHEGKPFRTWVLGLSGLLCLPEQVQTWTSLFSPHNTGPPTEWAMKGLLALLFLVALCFQSIFESHRIWFSSVEFNKPLYITPHSKLAIWQPIGPKCCYTMLFAQ